MNNSIFLVLQATPNKAIHNSRAHKTQKCGHMQFLFKNGAGELRNSAEKFQNISPQRSKSNAAKESFGHVKVSQVTARYSKNMYEHQEMWDIT